MSYKIPTKPQKSIPISDHSRPKDLKKVFIQILTDFAACSAKKANLKSHTLRIEVKQARRHNNNNGNSSSSLPAIRTNKFNFFCMSYSLIHPDPPLSMWNILYSLFHDRKIHPSVMECVRELKTGFSEGNCCSYYLKEKKNAFSHRTFYISDLMMRYTGGKMQDTKTTTTTRWKRCRQLAISYQKYIQIFP